MRRHHTAAPAEARLDDHRADVAASQCRADPCHGVAERFARGGVGHESDVGIELSGERLAERRVQATRGEGAVREPVVRAVECHHPRASRCEGRGLERGGHGVGAGRSEENARARYREQLGQALAQHDLRVGWVDVAQREPQAPRLFVDRAGHHGRHVPEQEGAEARREVDIAIAVDVGDVHAPWPRRADDGRGLDRGLSLWPEPLACVSRASAAGHIDRRQPRRQVARPRPRRFHEDRRKLSPRARLDGLSRRRGCVRRAWPHRASRRRA